MHSMTRLCYMLLVVSFHTTDLLIQNVNKQSRSLLLYMTFYFVLYEKDYMVKKSFKMWTVTSILFMIACNFLHLGHAYKPVVLVHGVMTGKHSMLFMAERIASLHPGTRIYITDRFSGWSSLEPMWRQVDAVGADIQSICALHPEGIHLLGYSQGGLISRAILEEFPDHNVDTFVSLSSPQGGQYGTKFLHLFFPNLVRESAYELFYSSAGQYTSVGNYWKDPYHQLLYYNYSDFLPYINNEITSKDSEDFKRGLTKLKKLILIGGPDDGVITPWQSSQFGYFSDSMDVVELHNQTIYQKDTIGLRSLEERGALQLLTFPNIDHFGWHLNETFIDNYLVPLFD